MHFHVLTLFPEMVLGGLKTSILGRACDKGLISIDAVNIRDYTTEKHNKVDDYPYGGGAGMLMQAQPVFDAYKSIAEKYHRKKPLRVIYVTPQGSVFNQDMARAFAQEENLVFLCGHYEGIDERVLEEIVTDYVSIGDYVLTGGELPAMVMIDAISRMVPGVLKNEDSGEFESFHENLLEYPQYTRPEVWHEKSVPTVLLSGDHAKVDKWRLLQSIERTKMRRPDLYEKYNLPGRALEYLKQDKLLHMDMIESIKRGNGEVLAVRADGVLLRDKKSNIHMVTAENKDAGERLLSFADTEAELFVCHQHFLADSVKARFGKKSSAACCQAVYTKKIPFSVDWPWEIRTLDESQIDVVYENYHELADRDELLLALKEGRIYGAFSDEELAGFIGLHEEGSMGMLTVFDTYRKQGIGLTLEKYLINCMLEQGHTPYGHIFIDNQISLLMQRKLGLKICPKNIFWVY